MRRPRFSIITLLLTVTVAALLAALVVGIGLLIWLRLVRVVDNVRSRAAIEDYLLGVEQALAGDLAGAHKRLSRVLEADPENHYARLLFGKVLNGRGEPAQAHKHHLYLQRAFGVDSVENDLQLARALAAVGRPVEAAGCRGFGLASRCGASGVCGPTRSNQRPPNAGKLLARPQILERFGQSGLRASTAGRSAAGMDLRERQRHLGGS